MRLGLNMQFDFKTNGIATFVLAMCLFIASSSVRADGFLIVNPKISLTKDEIKDVYTGEKQMVTGTRLIPIDNASEQEEFLKKFLETRKIKYESLWAKKSF